MVNESGRRAWLPDGNRCLSVGHRAGIRFLSLLVRPEITVAAIVAASEHAGSPS